MSKWMKLTKDNHIAWLNFNRPDASNAFNEEMIDEFVSLLEELDSDNQIRSIVLSGEGKHFCAGGDVKKMQNKEGMFAGEPNELRERYKRGIQKIPQCMERLSTPIIAMVNGAAIGAGLDVACMCDIRVAAQTAKFGETFAKLGLIPGDGGCFFLQRIVGFAKAMEMTLTADIYDADEALAMGLVSKVVALEKLKETVEELALKICSHPPIAIQMGKRSIVHAYRSDLASSLEMMAAFQGIGQRTSDHFESLSAIKEKKQGHFKHN